MNLNKSVAWTLRLGIILGLVLIVIGEMLSEDNPFLYFGLLILIASPLFAIIVTFLGLISEKDWFWAGIAGLVMLIVVCGAILAVL